MWVPGWMRGGESSGTKGVIYPTSATPDIAPSGLRMGPVEYYRSDPGAMMATFETRSGPPIGLIIAIVAIVVYFYFFARK